MTHIYEQIFQNKLVEVAELDRHLSLPFS